jgi:hypothetical protein
MKLFASATGGAFARALPRGSGRADNAAMNEDAARDVLLVRAIESAEGSRELIGEVDRRHAGRTAAELARWQASSAGAPPSAEVFLARRAALLLEKLAPTQPALARASRALAWRPAVGGLVAVVALLAGALAEQVGDRGHVNVLAFPLLAIVGWNLVVYLVLLAQALGRSARRAAAPESRAAAWPRLGALRGAFAAVTQRAAGAGRGALAPALRLFGADWSRAMAPLVRARVARLLHLGAALLAVGAVAGLYLRGLVFEYRIGWESTFLGAPAVHALLSAVLGPAAALLGIALPDVAGIEAIRFPASAGGARAADWIHLHALTVLLAVILPRLLLFALASLRARRLSRQLPIDLDAPYFRRLLGPLRSGEVRLRVVPYSYTVDEAAALGLRAVAQRLLGDGATLALAPSVAYGEEARAAAGLVAGDPQVPLTLALFSLAATPEAENHGEFLDVLARGLAPPSAASSAGAAALAVLVDEGPYRRRLGTAAGSGAAARLEERRQAWQAFAATRGLALACIDLAAPDLDGLERRVEPLLSGRAAAHGEALR